MTDFSGFELCCEPWEIFSHIALSVITGVFWARSLPREQLGDAIRGLTACGGASDAFLGISAKSIAPGLVISETYHMSVNLALD